MAESLPLLFSTRKAALNLPLHPVIKKEKNDLSALGFHFSQKANRMCRN